MKKLLSLWIVFTMIFLNTSTNLVFAADGIQIVDNYDGEAAPDATSIELDAQVSAKVNNSNPVSWFKFECTESGSYQFLASGSYDTYGVVYAYNEDESILELVDRNDDGDGSNFLVDVSLDSGKTYYLGATAYDLSSSTFSFKVLIRKSILHKKGEYAIEESINAGLDTSTIENIDIKETKTVNFSINDDLVRWFKFTPSTTATYSFFSTNSRVKVTGCIFYFETDEDGDTWSQDAYESIINYSNNDFVTTGKLEAGTTYYLGTAPSLITAETPDFSYEVGLTNDFLYKEEIAEKFESSFKAPTKSETLSLNKSKSVNISLDQTLQYFTYTATKTGDYMLYSEDLKQDNELFVALGEKGSSKYTVLNYSRQAPNGLIMVGDEMKKGKTYCFVIGYNNYSSFSKPSSFKIKLINNYMSTEITALNDATLYEDDYGFEHFIEWYISLKVGDSYTAKPTINKDANPKLTDWYFEDYEEEFGGTIEGATLQPTDKGVYRLTLSNGYDIAIVNVEVDDHVHNYGNEIIEKAKLSDTSATNGSIYRICQDCQYQRNYITIPVIKKMKLSTTEYTYNGKAKKPSVELYSYLKEFGYSDISYDNYSVSYASGRKNVGTYKVTATGKGKYYTGKMTATFKINPKGTKLSTVTSAKKAFTAKWKKQTAKMNKHITGYEIQYSTSSSFKSGNKTKVVKGYKSTSKKITGLKAKKKYYVRIRTYSTVSGKKYYSKWSAKKSVKTK